MALAAQTGQGTAVERGLSTAAESNWAISEKMSRERSGRRGASRSERRPEKLWGRVKMTVGQSEQQLLVEVFSEHEGALLAPGGAASRD
jgi:hypothetical protein